MNDYSEKSILRLVVKVHKGIFKCDAKKTLRYFLKHIAKNDRLKRGFALHAKAIAETLKNARMAVKH